MERMGYISIHAPLAGCDENNGDKGYLGKISIHAPLAGCDAILPVLISRGGDFNPRTPCGVRRVRAGCSAADHGDFNPRTPCGVRPVLKAVAGFANTFQSTHPLRGATRVFWR